MRIIANDVSLEMGTAGSNPALSALQQDVLGSTDSVGIFEDVFVCRGRNRQS